MCYSTSWKGLVVEGWCTTFIGHSILFLQLQVQPIGMEWAHLLRQWFEHDLERLQVTAARRLPQETVSWKFSLFERPIGRDQGLPEAIEPSFRYHLEKRTERPACRGESLSASDQVTCLSCVREYKDIWTKRALRMISR